MKHSSFDATISALDAETSALGNATSAITQSYWRYLRGVSGNCGFGITLQMCNRVTNHGDMSIFFKPVFRFDVHKFAHLIHDTAKKCVVHKSTYMRCILNLGKKS